MEIRVYYHSLGTHEGEWIDLPMDEEELEEIINKYTDSGRHDAIITDYEAPFKTDRYGLHKLNEIVQEMEEAMDEAGIDEEELEALLEVLDDPEVALEYLRNGGVRFYKAEDWADLAELLVYDYDWLEIPEHLRNYIDYEKLGRDLNYSGSFYQAENGYFVELIG